MQHRMKTLKYTKLMEKTTFIFEYVKVIMTYTVDSVHTEILYTSQ